MLSHRSGWKQYEKQSRSCCYSVRVCVQVVRGLHYWNSSWIKSVCPAAGSPPTLLSFSHTHTHTQWPSGFVFHLNGSSSPPLLLTLGCLHRPCLSASLSSLCPSLLSFFEFLLFWGPQFDPSCPWHKRFYSLSQSIQTPVARCQMLGPLIETNNDPWWARTGRCCVHVCVGLMSEDDGGSVTFTWWSPSHQLLSSPFFFFARLARQIVVQSCQLHDSKMKVGWEFYIQKKVMASYLKNQAGIILYCSHSKQIPGKTQTSNAAVSQYLLIFQLRLCPWTQFQSFLLNVLELFRGIPYIRLWMHTEH